MTSKQKRSLQSYRRVQGWALAHADILRVAPAPIAAHVLSLNGVVTRLESYATQQDAQQKLGTLDATDATLRRTAVRDAMRPIVQVARELRGTVFGISAISKMPDPNADTEAFVTAAISMAENAATFKTVMVDHGLQPDFVETLQTAATALKSSVDARGQAKSAGVGATNGIRADIVEGRKLVSFVDAGLMPQLRKDHATLASWRNAKRVTTKGVVGVITPPATTPAVTTPSTTPLAATAQVATVAPVTTVDPAITATPVAQVAPVAPVAPVATTTPVAQVTPVAPVATATPVAQVVLVTPVAQVPVTPVVPATPAVNATHTA